MPGLHPERHRPAVAADRGIRVHVCAGGAGWGDPQRLAATRRRRRRGEGDDPGTPELTTVCGIYTAPSGFKIAWMRDPDGNIIALEQEPDSSIWPLSASQPARTISRSDLAPGIAGDPPSVRANATPVAWCPPRRCGRVVSMSRSPAFRLDCAAASAQRRAAVPLGGGTWAGVGTTECGTKKLGWMAVDSTCGRRGARILRPTLRNWAGVRIGFGHDGYLASG
ncbi:hypothetical protein JOD67_003184 [Tenggerimyces flavus]|nr:hypothetical protein [Tenggerimyces flavus]